jgi:hypothetical protein
MKDSTGPSFNLPKIFRSIFWEPLVMAGAVGDRYRQYRKWQAAVEAMRTGIRIGMEIERRNHSASHTCSPLPGLHGSAPLGDPLHE